VAVGAVLAATCAQLAPVVFVPVFVCDAVVPPVVDA
jgi:hypothetical protein